MIGTELGHYQILERIGHGGMGEVYKARDSALGRFAAIKVIQSERLGDPERRRRFAQEARTASSLNHPNIVTIYEISKERGVDFIAMEYVEGKTLDSLIPDSGMRIGLLLKVAIQVAEGLARAHAAGIIHRDLKPTNIMVTGEGHAKVLDFGLAKLVEKQENSSADTAERTSDRTLTGERVIVGTAAYMSPEQAECQPLDGRSDIFSFGAVLYEMATGKRAFRGSSPSSILAAVIKEDPIPAGRLAADLPLGLQRLIERCLRKDPARRAQHMDDVKVQLEDVVQELDTAKLVPEQENEEGKKRRRKRGILGLAAALVLAAAIILNVFPAVRSRLTKWILPNPLPELRCVAVLPLAVPGSDHREAAFSQGLAESLALRLSTLFPRDSCYVVPARLLKDRRITSVAELAEETGANLALTGELSRSGSDYLATLRLVDERDGRTVAEELVLEPIERSIDLQFSLTTAAVELLGGTLTPPEIRLMSSFGTKSHPAYYLYLRGSGYMGTANGPASLQLAAEDFREALALDAGFADAKVGLGYALMAQASESAESQGLLNKAQALCEQAAAANPEMVPAELCLGDVQIRKNQLRQAIPHYEKALYLDHFNAAAVSGLCDTYSSLGEAARSETTVRQAISRQPGFWQWHSWLGVDLFLASRYHEAIEELEKATELAPRYYRAFFSLGAAYCETGNWERAAEALKQSIEIHPDAAAFTNLGTACFFQGKLHDAVEHFKTAIVYQEKEEPLTFTYYGNLGEALYWAPGSREHAYPHLKKAVEMGEAELSSAGRHATRLGRLALYCTLIGNTEKAREYMGQALEIEPGNAENLLKAAVIEQQAGASSRALAFLADALVKGLNREKVRRHPAFSSLRDDPEFREMVAFDERREMPY